MRLLIIVWLILGGYGLSNEVTPTLEQINQKKIIIKAQIKEIKDEQFYFLQKLIDTPYERKKAFYYTRVRRLAKRIRPLEAQLIKLIQLQRNRI